MRITRAREHNLKDLTVDIPGGITAVSGVSGSGKSSLAFDTLYHEAHRRLLDLYSVTPAHQRLLPADVDQIDALLPAVAVAQNVLNRNPNSTVATASGVHPFLRLLYAGFGERACPECGTVLSYSSLDALSERLVAPGTQGPVLAVLVLRGIGSHATLLSALSSLGPVLVDGAAYCGDPLDPDTPHDIAVEVGAVEPDTGATSDGRISPQARAAAARLIDAITALGARVVRIGAEGDAETVALARICPGCGLAYRPLDQSLFNRPCRSCDGSGCDRCHHTGLHQAAAAVRLAGSTITDFLSRDVNGALRFLEDNLLPDEASRLLLEIGKRLSAIRDLGLGYLTLDRPSPSLSRGEAQRLRLSVCLTSRLEMLHVLDEPTVGLHACDTHGLFAALRRLQGPVVVVEHDRTAVMLSDHSVDLGPGAGDRGGELLYAGEPAGLLAQDSPSGRCFSQPTTTAGGTRSAATEYLLVSKARANNLQEIDVRIPIGRLSVVSGVSGSGKSSLVHQVIGRSFQEGGAVNCAAISAAGLRCVVVDQGPIGRNPRSTPATFTKLSDLIRDLFAERTGLSPSVFSFNRPEGACPECGGIGANEIAMRMLPSIWTECASCGGRRFNETALQATTRLGGHAVSIADIYEMPIEEVGALLDQAGERDASRLRRLGDLLETLMSIGLGYLQLGQPSPTLSGGEAQRIKLAKFLGRGSLRGQLLILDEPSTGLHPADIAGLSSALNRMVEAGTTVVMVEHNPELIRTADWAIDLGPGAGPHGGTLVYEGELSGLLEHPTSRTGQALRDEAHRMPEPGRAPPKTERPSAISIRGAAIHNLRSVSVEIPHGSLTVVTGVSGSGKSSLVRDVLEAEAKRRFLESLSMYERQGLHEKASSECEIGGLGVTIGVDPRRTRFSLRSTVGRTTEIHRKLAVLFAYSNERDCLSCGAAMQRGEAWQCPRCAAQAAILDAPMFFSSTYRAACRSCHGVGSHTVPNPDKLITRPELPLCGGAMHSPGFFPKGYLCKPFNVGYYVVRAFARHHGFDPETTPWNEMSEEARHSFLFGQEEPLVVTSESRTGRTTTRTQEFGGFYRWIGDWDVGGTYTDQRRCEACAGTGLRPEPLAVKLGGESIDALCTMMLSDLSEHLAAYTPAVSGPADETVRMAHEAALRRSRFLVHAGVGYLHLNRPDGSLSAGEMQRVTLAALLGSGLSGLTLLLDEPSRGLHPDEVGRLIGVLEELRDEGNTVVVVEHEPAFVAAADHLIEMGPGSGDDGGSVVYAGPPDGLVEVVDSHTAAWLAGERRLPIASGRPQPSTWLELRGASGNNLRSIDLRVPIRRLVGVCGVSGSGKSSLVVDTLARIVAPIRHTTSVAYEPIDPGPYQELVGAPESAIVIDQSRKGIGSPGSFLGLDKEIARIYAAAADGTGAPVPKQARRVDEMREDLDALVLTGSAGVPEGTSSIPGSAQSARDRASRRQDPLVLGPVDPQELRRACTGCGGSGQIRHEMGFLPNLYDSCELCGGSGYSPSIGAVACRGVPLAQVAALSLEEVMTVFGDCARLRCRLQPALDLGLGYLLLHQPRISLSGGEVQRLKIAGSLRKKPAALYILDEPTIGQHLEDVRRLIGVLQRVVDTGATVLVVEHHPHLLCCCDWLVELGPGAGPEGGEVIFQGTPAQLAAGTTPIARHLAALLGEA